MGQLLNVEMALGLLAKVQEEHVLDMEVLVVGYKIVSILDILILDKKIAPDQLRGYLT